MYYSYVVALLATNVVTLVHSSPYQLPLPPDITLASRMGKSPADPLMYPDGFVDTKDDYEKLDIEYGKCYRISDTNNEKLGLLGNYYQFSGGGVDRVFKVCREFQGACKNEDRNDQKVRSYEHFYLKDSQGSPASTGATWMASGGALLWPLPAGYSNIFVSKLRGHKTCDDDDDDDPPPKKSCQICVSQRDSYNNWNGLTTDTRKLILTSPNAEQCLYFNFKKVNCPSSILSGDLED